MLQVIHVLRQKGIVGGLLGSHIALRNVRIFDVLDLGVGGLLTKLVVHDHLEPVLWSAEGPVLDLHGVLEGVGVEEDVISEVVDLNGVLADHVDAHEEAWLRQTRILGVGLGAPVGARPKGRWIDGVGEDELEGSLSVHGCA